MPIRGTELLMLIALFTVLATAKERHQVRNHREALQSSLNSQANPAPLFPFRRADIGSGGIRTQKHV